MRRGPAATAKQGLAEAACRAMYFMKAAHCSENCSWQEYCADEAPISSVRVETK